MSNFLKIIGKEFGDDVIVTGQKDLEFIPTGSVSLDAAIGGGLPLTKMIEIAGSEGTGKTTTALSISRNAIENDYNVLYVDVENMLDMEYFNTVLDDKLYEYLEEGKLIIIQPETGEDALLIVEEALKDGNFGLVVIDSVGALTPKREKEKELTDSTVGETARLLSKFLRRNAFHIRRNDVAVLFINQVRDNVSSYMGGYVTPGGHALLHYLSVRVMLKKGKVFTEGKEKVGVLAPFTIKKNKIATPYRSGTIPIRFGKGIDKYMDLIEFGKAMGVIVTRGPYYIYQPNEDEEIRLGQGMKQSVEKLKEDDELYERIRQECLDEF